jgi:magnesium chelatase family protein
MLARVFSCAVIGLDGVVVEVEVDTGPTAGMTIGYPMRRPETVSVSRRFKNAGIEFLVSASCQFSPASVRKEGPATICPLPWVCWS